jgi:rubrerythrin
MFNTKQYRDKAAEYSERGKTANRPNETQEFEQLEKNFTALADNEQWLADKHQKSLQARAADAAPAGNILVEQEEHVLRCLGAALIMQWNTLPRKLQRELFDNASSMGELLDTAALRGQIARFLHKHKDEKTHGADVAKD